MLTGPTPTPSIRTNALPMTTTPPPSTAVRQDRLPSAGPIQYRQRGALRLAAVLAAGIGTLAWLGRSSDPAAKPLSAGPLTLGAAIAFTGNANLYGQDQRMGLAVAERWAQQAGAPPRLVHLQLEDGASDEPSAIAAFNLLIRQGVIALIGPTLSQQAFAADPIAQRQGVPVVAPSNTAAGIPEIGPFISRVSAQSSVIAPLSLDEALRRDPAIKRVAVFYAQDDAYSTAEVAIFQKALAARGLTPVTVQRTQLADNDFQTPITSTLPLKPQLVVLSVQAVAGGNLIRQLRELGYRGQIVVGNGLNTPNIYPICQRWCDGILIAQAYSPELNTPLYRRVLQLFQQAHGDRPPPQITAQAFTAYQVLFEAIQRLERKGGLTGVTLSQARTNLMTELLSGTYNTPLGPIGFSPEGEVLQDRFYVAEVRMAPGGRDGRFALVRELQLQDSQP